MEKTKKLKPAIGADIGGSHFTCALVDMTTHTEDKNSEVTVKVDNKASADDIIGKWCGAIRQTIRTGGVEVPEGIGLAMPGPFDYLEGIALFEGVDKFDLLKGVNVAERMGEMLAFPVEVPVRFINDATAFAVGAVWLEPGPGKRNVLALTLGTGLGSAFIMDSLPVITDPRVPEMGCVYHLPYKKGIADDTFSTRGLIKSYKERSGKTAKDVKEIAVLARTDKDAEETFLQFGTELSDFLGSWIKKAAITDIIIGGNISRSYELFRATFDEGLRETGQSVKVHLADNTEQMAILGSARLADNDYYARLRPLLKDM